METKKVGQKQDYHKREGTINLNLPYIPFFSWYSIRRDLMNTF